MDIHSPYVCIDTISTVNMYILRKISELKEIKGNNSAKSRIAALRENVKIRLKILDFLYSFLFYLLLFLSY